AGSAAAASGIGSGSAGGKGSGFGSSAGSADMLGGFQNSALGGMLGMFGGGAGGGAGGAGGAGGDANDARGASLIGSKYSMFQDILKVSIRKVTLTMRWKVLGRDRDLPVVSYFTDQAAMDKVLKGFGSTELPDDGGAGTGSGKGSGTTKSGGNGGGKTK
ncbi:MAG: hypothetical protein NT062_12275, partial [Proteobacteria bacterium]|nr:hypothetical protein [Pseudomonadota bacterium]